MKHVKLNPDEWLHYPALARETYYRMTSEGILLAAQAADGRLNAMTIGWGLFGLVWGRPLFQVLVRPSRYTYQCIERTSDYTVCVLPPELTEVATYCGTMSGRDVDKLSEKDLTILPSTHITSGGIAQANIVFECKVVHYNEVQAPAFPVEIVTNYYPDGDWHRIYFGEILGVSVSKEFFDSLP
ncbi:MAG: flavin reductase [Planctomycetes bacterium]|nr:flavin reductase [Planctomycetota bacterium]